MIFVFILFIFLSLFWPFAFSLLRIHFWPLPFPSENFAGHSKKVYETARTRFRRSFRLCARLLRDETG